MATAEAISDASLRDGLAKLNAFEAERPHLTPRGELERKLRLMLMWFIGIRIAMLGAVARYLDGRVDVVKDQMSAEISKVETQLRGDFGALERRVSALELRMDALEARMTALETRLDAFEANMNEQLSAILAAVSQPES